MNLVIDKGNTCSKVAVFDGEKMIFCQREEILSIPYLESMFRQFQISNAILSTVSGIDGSILDFLSSQCNFTLFTVKTPMPIKLAYVTPETLGSDRLAAVLGAYFLNPQENFVVIDCGTCITYEVFVDNCYLGGNILPGMQMRFKALSSGTAGLPMVNPQEGDLLFGKDTISAIRAGVQNGIVYEMEGFITAIQERFGKLNVFLTGGDCHFFEKCLKNRIFAVENLTLIGLNELIEHNA